MYISSNLYTNPLYSSPLLPLLLASLRTQKNAPDEATSFQKEYDYIIVGAGSAGSVVANRLSEEPCVSVLLLEAGKAAPVMSDVPAIFRSLAGTEIDWQYMTVPQKHTAESMPNRQVPWPGGKGFGGSSLINAMFYVRGNKKDFDNWAAEGADGWSYQEVLPYFLKAEDNRNELDVEDGYHKTGGPLTVESPNYISQYKTALEKAVKSLGYEIIDSNAAHQTGFDEYQGTLRNAQRCSTGKAYLVPAENRTNLDIIGGAHVRKVLIDGTQANGVEFEYNSTTHRVKAKREVIVSAGTVNTAQILMLSGIGPKEHLEKFNIPVVADLPVGDNFHDHGAGILPFTINPDPISNNLSSNESIEEYINNRTGPLSLPYNIPVIAFLNAKSIHPKVDYPDYELYLLEGSKELAKSQFGYIKLNSDTNETDENYAVLLCTSQILHPKSRGTIRLNSSDPFDPPLIDPNYFADQSDVDDVVAGMETCMNISFTESMQQVGMEMVTSIFPNCSFDKQNLKDFLECYVRNYVVTISHPVGVCKMGNPKDNTTVVDPQLRVKGIKGLRVVDASIMPKITAGNTNAPTIMIGEKASDIIKETIKCTN